MGWMPIFVLFCFCITLLLLFVFSCLFLVYLYIIFLSVIVTGFVVEFVTHWLVSMFIIYKWLWHSFWLRLSLSDCDCDWFCDHVHFWVSDSVDVQALQELTKPHIDSYNYLLNEGLHKMVQVQTLSTQQAPCILNTLLQLLSHHQRL